MRIKYYLVFICMFLTVLQPLHSQIKKGAWRDHLAYTQTYRVVNTEKKVFCSGERSGLISYDKHSGEIEKYSTVNGLSDINISALSYSAKTGKLVIGHESGKIDIITRNGFINLPDIYRKSIQQSKRINEIECYENYAYLACGFGIVVVDLSKMEIKESYFFGPGGSYIQVNDVAIYNNYIFAATASGIYRASLESPNLLDFNFWNKLEFLPDTEAEYTSLEAFGDVIFATYKADSLDDDNLIYFDNSDTYNNLFFPDTEIRNIRSYNGYLSISGQDYLQFYNSDLQLFKTFTDLGSSCAIYNSDEGSYYVASMYLGLVKSDAANNYSYIGVSGPRFNEMGVVVAKDEYIWIGSGSIYEWFTSGGAYRFHDEKWISLNQGWSEGLDSVGNFVKIAYDPMNSEHIYLSCMTKGIYEIEGDRVIKRHLYDNTDVFSTYISPSVNVRISAMAFDNYNNLWAVQNQEAQPVFVLRNNGEWEHMQLKSEQFNGGTYYSDIVVTESNQIWILTLREGIIVLQEQSDGTILEKSFSIRNQESELISQGISMELDKEGNIWIGTNKGPIIYTPTYDLFERDDIVGYQIKLPREDDPTLAEFLLNYEWINEIAVDGGNRKWLATRASGVFLVSPDGKKTIHHFTTDNSPLFTNNINGIDVNDKTGEVFISSSKGLLTFMSTSTEGLDDFTDVYVFPNPVKPDFTGIITITGLIEDANVKITDISGNLVYETTSLGGQAVWDGKNFDGRRVNTGVYLVFMTNSDGTKTHITKLLFIH